MRRAPLLSLLALACAPTDPGGEGRAPYSATVRWTAHGVPHIVADDWGSLGYGIGYAQARDHGCTILDQVVKVRGERARWHGEAHVDADFGWRALELVPQAEALLPDLSDEVRDVFTGFAAGVSRWVEEGDLHPACVDAPWVRPLDAVDVVAHALALSLEGSAAVLIPEIGRGEPPSGQRSVARAAPPGLDRLHEIGATLRDPKRGSNGWAIGRDRSASGGGMVLSNTHFPAWGEKRWHELHVTLPGEVDAYGAGLVGVPAVNVGFNAHVAWTHTVSYAPRFVGYLLTLDPEDPTRYLYDGRYQAMTAHPHAVEVATGDGGTRTVERTLYRSRWGPVIDAPVIGWSKTLAVSFRDANADNRGIFDVWFRMMRADSLDALVEAQRATQGIPWVYTLAADVDGEVFFGDTSRVPHLSDEAIAAWAASLSSGPMSLFARAFADAGLIAVDAADPVFDWVEDPRATVPGLVPFEEAPTDRRTDYAFNANDSHWLHHATEPLNGFNQTLYGPERTARTARTRMNARYLHETGEGTASGADGRFTLEELEAAALSMRSSLTEAALDDVVDRCAGTLTVRLDGADVDVADACAALAAWDGRYTADAVGAVVWRELLASSPFDAYDLNAGGGGLFTTPFDPDDPLHTPRDVVPAPAPDPEAATHPDPLLRGLAEAVLRLEGVGIPVDAPLGEVQHLLLGDPDAPVAVGVPGGTYWEGTIGIADFSAGTTSTLLPWPRRGAVVNATSELTADGYPVNNGNSFLLAVELGPSGPHARAVTTYSQSTDWGSPHLADQGPIYASGSLREVWFQDADVEAATVEELVLAEE